MGAPSSLVPLAPGTGRRVSRAPLIWSIALGLAFIAQLPMPAFVLFATPGEYAPVHTLFEFGSMAISLMIVALAWNLRATDINNRMMVLGAGCLAVGILDLVHVLSYEGMPDFLTPNGVEKSIATWLAARLIAAVVLLIVALMPAGHWPVRAWWLLVSAALIVSLVVAWAATYHSDALPRTYIIGEGLTTFKVVAEGATVAIFWLAALVFLLRARRERTDQEAWLAAAAWTFGLAGLFFTLYTTITDINNLMGHVFKIVGYLMIYRAIFVSGVRAPYEAVSRERSLMRSLINSLSDLVFIKSPNGQYAGVNDPYQRLVGRPVGEIIGHTDDDLFPAERARSNRELDARVLNEGQSIHDEETVTLDDGSHRIFDTVRSPLLDDRHEVVGVIGVSRDVTDQLLANDRIEHLVNYDQLTGLPNQNLVSDRAHQALARSERESETLAVVLLDLDEFKNVNETISHEAGDTLLREVATRLQGVIRDGDTLGRISGDEFVLLLVDADTTDAAILTESALAALREPVSLAGVSLVMTASAGIAMYPADGTDYAALLRGADAAMYLAKQSGRNTARFFAEESQARARERLDVLAQLRGAAARGELVLHYQPQVSLATGEIVGAEALVRWEHPTRGLLGPGAFIPIAEDGDLIVEVGEWVMRTAVAQMRAWIDAGFLRDGQMTVNVSARHMQRQAFAPWVQHVLDGVGLPPRHLLLELTETAAMSQPEIAIRAIEQLARIGVGVALDDFGTGYSSMAYLRQFDIATIKIDKSLIDDVGRVEDASAIVAAIIQLARTLGYQTLAEGVETQTQWDFLRQHDCDQMQGFFVSPGVPAEEFLALVRHPPIPMIAE